MCLAPGSGRTRCIKYAVEAPPTPYTPDSRMTTSHHLVQGRVQFFLEAMRCAVRRPAMHAVPVERVPGDAKALHHFLVFGPVTRFG
ncbi:hypothetical protein E2C01_073432 [Portunus trituberculatus]|uniref:Uncharacterized protein n=1 Tax=Portunus trituberculatus TaxID=210409 RepID=A0A5B7IDX7_PORTR|nr:hypothetical protein [Portunus trituberculatus]